MPTSGMGAHNTVCPVRALPAASKAMTGTQVKSVEAGTQVNAVSASVSGAPRATTIAERRIGNRRPDGVLIEIDVRSMVSSTAKATVHGVLISTIGGQISAIFPASNPGKRHWSVSPRRSSDPLIKSLTNTLPSSE